MRNNFSFAAYSTTTTTGNEKLMEAIPAQAMCARSSSTYVDMYMHMCQYMSESSGGSGNKSSIGSLAWWWWCPVQLSYSLREREKPRRRKWRIGK